jgi:hypothetical protein
MRKNSKYHKIISIVNSNLTNYLITYVRRLHFLNIWNYDFSLLSVNFKLY